MSIAPGFASPEGALEQVAPDRREFAILYAEGKTDVSQMLQICDISSATYYRWLKEDKAIAAYADAAGRQVATRAKRQLRAQVDVALQAIVGLLTDADTPHAVKLRAATEILDRAGVTKEELTRAGVGGGDTVVQVNLAIPVNADARAQQEERQRRRSAALEATYVESTDR